MFRALPASFAWPAFSASLPKVNPDDTGARARARAGCAACVRCARARAGVGAHAWGGGGQLVGRVGVGVGAGGWTSKAGEWSEKVCLGWLLLSLSLPMCLCFSSYLDRSTYLPVYLSIHLPTYLCIYPPLYLSIYLAISVFM